MTLLPKPQKGGRKREKARAKRDESKLIKAVRAEVVERDGWCRFPHAGSDWPECDVFSSELAHLWETRAKTRGQAPEKRHTTRGTCMLCRYAHHELIDGNKVDVIPADHVSGANGDLIFIDHVRGCVVGVT